jgi:hypothetical protein
LGSAEVRRERSHPIDPNIPGRTARDGAFDDGGMKIRCQNRLAFLAALPDRLGVSVVEIDQHHHAGLRCNAGQGNESNGLFVVSPPDNSACMGESHL